MLMPPFCQIYCADCRQQERRGHASISPKCRRTAAAVAASIIILFFADAATPMMSLPPFATPCRAARDTPILSIAADTRRCRRDTRVYAKSALC